MTKISRWPLKQKKLTVMELRFWKVVAGLRTAKKARLFFRDLLTHTERQMLAKRLQIAEMLLNHQSYKEIKKGLHVTDTTIAKVNNWLSAFGQGYRLAFGKSKK